MVLNNIEALLEKYNNAETTLKEEAQLRAYFASHNVAPHLEHYKPLFLYFSQSQQEQYTKDVSLAPKVFGIRRTIMYQWLSVAAIAVLMLGIFIPNWSQPEKTGLAALTEEQREVYEQTMEALSLVSIGMKKGKQQFNSLAMVSQNLNQGITEASRLNEFSKATNRIFKNK